MGYVDLIMPFPYQPIHSYHPARSKHLSSTPPPSLVRYRVIMIVPSRLHWRRVAKRRASSLLRAYMLPQQNVSWLWREVTDGASFRGLVAVASCVRENFRSHTTESGTNCRPYPRVVMLIEQFDVISSTRLVTVNKVFSSCNARNSHLARALFPAASAKLDCLARVPIGRSCGISSSESISPSDSVDLSEDSDSSSRWRS